MSTPLHSMTGHGVGEARLGQGRVLIELRSLNHRYLDVRVRLPPVLAEHAAQVDERIRRSLRRGRVEATGRVEGDVLGPASLDHRRARAAFAELSALRDELRPDEPVPLSLLSCVPELFSSRDHADHQTAQKALIAACETACAQLWEMRRREGVALAADFEGHLHQLQAQLVAVQERIPAVVDEYRARLRQRIDRLLADEDVSLDPRRLEHEVALFADRADVAEEIARLGSHADQLRELLRGSEEGVGKRLDFLLQEMSREVNTLGSKSADVELIRAVIEMKAAVSRMREQAQNVF